MYGVLAGALTATREAVPDACLDETLRSGKADAAGSAGDQDDPVLQFGPWADALP